MTPASLLVLAALTLPPPEPSAEGVEFFEAKVRPVLLTHCYSCHSAVGKKPKGGLRLDTREGVMRGGQSGSVVTAKAADSPLVKAVRHADGVEAMPPKDKEKLSAAVVADLEKWVAMGAPMPPDGAATHRLDLAKAKDFWSFKPVVRPDVPRHGAANPIDNFILAKLATNGKSLSPPADKRTLLRRATFDLTGLPPTPEEIVAFLKDDSPEAFATVVDRLLASRAYGERWGRHWMDVIR